MRSSPLTRRSLLRNVAIAIGFAWPLRSRAIASTQQKPTTPTTTLPQILGVLAPFPAKQAQLAAEYGRSGQASLLWRLLTENLLPHSPPTTHMVSVITQNRWNTGVLPNYSHAAQRNGHDWAWVACFGNRTVTAIDVTADTVTQYDTGPNTNPLDLFYDARRDRLLVASAEPQAKMLVLAGNGEVLHTLPLAPLTGQGNSDGGIQGVTIDANGHYWCALSYHGIHNGGVLVQVDGDTWAVRQIVKNVGMNNPNGLITGFRGEVLFACSDNGYAQQFDLAGNLQRTIESVSTGYRGATHGYDLWVTGWLTEGKMARIDLETGERVLFPCIPLGNSIQIDSQGYIWVAGDAGVSVSTQNGELLGMFSFGAFTNGLAVLSDDVYLVSYDQKYHRALALDEQVFLPIIPMELGR